MKTTFSNLHDRFSAFLDSGGFQIRLRHLRIPTQFSLSLRYPPSRLALFLMMLVLVPACTFLSPGSPTPGQTQTSTPSPTETAAPSKPQAPSQTPEPTRTKRPSPTPKPSPTLPAGEDFDCLPADGERVSAIVAGVIDGDTIIVQAGIQSFTVRYIGVDTPETNVVPAERMGLEAKTRNRELVSGKRVILVSDPIVGNTDIYDRLLRYVLTGDTFVNIVLVRDGFARYYAGEMACGETVFAAEVQARSDQAGLWAKNPTPTP